MPANKHTNAASPQRSDEEVEGTAGKARDLAAEARKIIGNKTLSDKEKITWCQDILENQDNATTKAERRAFELECQNTEMRKTLNELGAAHDQQIMDSSRQRAELRELEDALREAKEKSKRNETDMKTAEASNTQLRATTEKQGELLQSWQNEERHLREVVYLRNVAVEDLQSKLDQAALEVLEYRHRLTGLERDGGEWTHNVNRYCKALREENDYLREQVNRAFGTGTSVEHTFGPGMLAAEYNTDPDGTQPRAIEAAPIASRFNRGSVDAEMRDAGPDPFRPPSRMDRRASVADVYMSDPEPSIPPQPSSDGSGSSSPSGHGSEGWSSRSKSPRDQSRINQGPFNGWREGGKTFFVRLGKPSDLKAITESRKRSCSTPGVQPSEKTGQSARRIKRRLCHILASNPSNPSGNYPFDPEGDKEMASVMKNLRVKADSYVLESAEFKAKTTSVSKPSSRVLTRKEKNYPGPLYLPKRHSPTPLKSRLKRSWELPPRKWTSLKEGETLSSISEEMDTGLTDIMSLQGDDMEFEEMEGGLHDEGTEGEEAKGLQVKTFSPLVHLLFLAVIAWLLLSNQCGGSQKPTWGGVSRPSKSSWEKINREPDDLFILLRGSETKELRKVTKMDYEMAKWSDIDVNVVG